jgi:peptidyl-prolyl cis-trans isomerase D
MFFDTIRNHRRALFFVLMVLIIPSFVLFGIDGFRRLGEDANPVAMIDGKKITQAEFDAAHRRNIDRMRQMFGENFDLKLADTPEAKKATLEELLRERTLQKMLRDNHLTITDQKLRDTIINDPALARLKRPDGSFDVEGYKQFLAAQGLTAEMLEQRMRDGLSLQLATQAVQGSALSPAVLGERAYALRFERRKLQVALVRADALASQIKPGDADVEAFYKANGKLFEMPETATVQYVVLDQAAVMARVSVNDDEVKTYYEQNKDRWRNPELRRASHILIAVDKSAPEAQRNAAKAKAEQLLAEVRKPGASFADIAKQHSQDPGSAKNGGDLDFFPRTAMVKPFADATWALKEGEISDLVLSDFGWHIIKLTGIRPEVQKPFDAVKGEIEGELKRQQASRKFAEVAEQFSNAVYEQADTFKPIAEKLGLQIKENLVIGRQPNRALGAGNPLANEKFLRAVFSADSIKKRSNTEAIELAPNTLASGRIVSYQPVKVRPFDEVKEIARSGYVEREAAKLAKSKGEQWLKALQAGGPPPADMPAWGEAVVVDRNMGQNPDAPVPPAAVNAAYKMAADKLPAYTGAEVAGKGYALIKLEAVLPPESAEEARKNAEAQRLNQMWAVAESTLYIEALKKRYKAETKVDFGKSAAAGEDAAAKP